MPPMSIMDIGFLGSAGKIGGVVGGWKELGRTSSVTPIDVVGLANKRYYMILTHLIGNGAVVPKLVTGNTTFDTGSNYAERRQSNGTEGTASSATNISWSGVQVENTETQFGVGYWENLSAKEKLLLWESNQSEAIGSGTVPSRREGGGKWSNTANLIDRFQINDGGGVGDFDANSELIVLGWDPSDTHTDNFWEELATKNATGSQTSFDTGVFTSKKYYWIQVWAKASVGNVSLRVGKTTIDAGNNYAMRHSTDGVADVTTPNFSSIIQYDSPNGTFINFFLVNRATNEKLGIAHSVETSPGTGAGTAPKRREHASKWDDVTNQIDIMQVINTAGGATNFTSDSIIKVWGHD